MIVCARCGINPHSVWSAFWPTSRTPGLPLWPETGEYHRRRPPDPPAEIRALKARERVYAALGGGWGGSDQNPFNALIFEDAR